MFTATAMEVSLTDKVKKAPKRKRVIEDSGETAKRRSARVRNTKCKKEEKIDFQELLFKYLPSRLKKFDPDDDESLSNLGTQCEGKEDIQPLHGSCLPVDSVEYMESGMLCIRYLLCMPVASHHFIYLNKLCILLYRTTRCPQLSTQ